ncbi:MAG: hypothetical protein AAB581_01735 [Patescibacteria group bacterium]
MQNTIILIVIVVIIGALVYMVSQQYFAGTPAVPSGVEVQQQRVDQTSPAAIEQDLKEINTGDLDREFQSIDADLGVL